MHRSKVAFIGEQASRDTLSEWAEGIVTLTLVREQLTEAVTIRKANARETSQKSKTDAETVSVLLTASTW